MTRRPRKSNSKPRAFQPRCDLGRRLSMACLAIVVLGMIVWAAFDHLDPHHATQPKLAVHTITENCYTPEEIARHYGWQGDWRDYMVRVARLNGWRSWTQLRSGDQLNVLDYRMERPREVMLNDVNAFHHETDREIVLRKNARGGKAVAGCTHKIVGRAFPRPPMISPAAPSAGNAAGRVQPRGRPPATTTSSSARVVSGTPERTPGGPALGSSTHGPGRPSNREQAPGGRSPPPLEIEPPAGRPETSDGRPATLGD